MEAIAASPVQTVVQKTSDVMGFSAVGNWLGVDPVLLMFWTFAGWVCVFHIFLLWWMSPSMVSFFRGDGIFLGKVPGMTWVRNKWVKFVRKVEDKRTGSIVWWRIMWVFYAIWTAIMQGPYNLLMQLMSNPDTSRLIGMGVIFPIGLACYLWVFMNPRLPFMAWAIKKLPSGWIEPPGSTESIVWITVFTVGILCGAVEFLHAFYPPIVKLVLGDVPVPLFHAGILIAAGFACIMTGIDVDGNHPKSPEDTTKSYQRARSTHIAILGVSLLAVVVTYLVLPAVDRKSFLSISMRPMHFA
jgi:hypothetical protein